MFHLLLLLWCFLLLLLFGCLFLYLLMFYRYIPLLWGDFFIFLMLAYSKRFIAKITSAFLHTQLISAKHFDVL